MYYSVTLLMLFYNSFWLTFQRKCPWGKFSFIQKISCDLHFLFTRYNKTLLKCFPHVKTGNWSNEDKVCQNTVGCNLHCKQNNTYLMPWWPKVNLCVTAHSLPTLINAVFVSVGLHFLKSVFKTKPGSELTLWCFELNTLVLEMNCIFFWFYFLLQKGSHFLHTLCIISLHSLFFNLKTQHALAVSFFMTKAHAICFFSYFFQRK